MARRRKLRVRKNDGDELPELKFSPQVKRGIAVVAFVLLAVITFLAFFDLAGSLGRIVTKILSLLFGMGAVASPLIFASVALALFLAGRREDDEDAPVGNLKVYIGAGLFTIALTGILHLLAMRNNPASALDLVKAGSGGGYFGVLAALPLYSLVDFWASLLILIGLVIISVIVLFEINISELFKRREARPSASAKTPADLREIKINKMQSSGFNVSKVLETARAEAEEEPASSAD